jgi:hypothetical protein
MVAVVVSGGFDDDRLNCFIGKLKDSSFSLSSFWFPSSNFSIPLFLSGMRKDCFELYYTIHPAQRLQNNKKTNYKPAFSSLLLLLRITYSITHFLSPNSFDVQEGGLRKPLFIPF